jgi:hypothetical protein
MVAVRRFWGHNKEQPAQHQSARGGDLGVEAVLEDRGGAGELRGLGARVEPGRPVDQEDDREAEQPEGEDDAAEAPAPLVAHRDDGERRGE